MNWNWLITRHTLFSLGWDEWASIFAILTTIVIVVTWLSKKIKKDFLGETNTQLKILNHNMEVKNQHDAKVDKRLNEGHEKFMRHDFTLKDHEKRIKRLEDDEYDNKHH